MKLPERDWQNIQTEYRIGKTVRELSIKYQVPLATIYNRAKVGEWEPDLLRRYRKKVKTKLLGDTTNTPKSNATDESLEIIAETKLEEVANQAVDVIRRHRRDIAKAADLVSKYMSELEENREYKRPRYKREPGKDKYVEATLTLKEKADTLHCLAMALNKLAPLERQAYNLDEASDPDAPDSIELIEYRQSSEESVPITV